jgi:hypothetical protein
MLVHHDEKVPLARLLTFLECGERMAHDCASAQAALVEDDGSRRFLLSQARQEAAHAVVFRGAIAWLAPKHLGNAPFLPALETYRALIHEALLRKDVIETLLAEQVILEGLGESILTRIEEGLVKRGAPFVLLRRTLLKQEEAHHGFGRRLLERAMAGGIVDAHTLRDRAQKYFSLIDQMMLPVRDLFEAIAEDPTAYTDGVRSFMPDWLRDEPRSAAGHPASRGRVNEPITLS